ncbi:hypothetical protein [Myxococcus landrumensis]|uniref:Uncharacterized protein n=1 Tax=Myxococcus landrumensis TaxID=2813577 RepID=A0ABX7NDE4_9BACT|nr:hypothetical protein [Myxococcus landrumus]QSQ15622.1 hypothetical protein JY572_06030 [Myxococcus landrumus]
MNVAEMSRIMDSLYEHRAPALPSHALADNFDRMIWCLDDQGAALLQVREDWLISGDRGRVEVALDMEETFPFSDSQKMNDVLGQISARWPELSAKCRSIQEARASGESR